MTGAWVLQAGQAARARRAGSRSARRRGPDRQEAGAPGGEGQTGRKQERQAARPDRQEAGAPGGESQTGRKQERQAARARQAGMLDAAGKGERADRMDIDITEIETKTDKTGGTGKAKKAAMTGTTGKAERAVATGRVQKTGMAGKTGRADRPGNKGLAGQETASVRLLVLLCAACYFVSYITRINYGAVILEIQRAEGMARTAVSMAVTGSFVTYGAGQLVSGWLGDRMKPDRLILAGILLSAGMNLCVPTFTDPVLILVFWCVNGFAQALIWPPMVKILSACLDQEQYKKACVRVTWGSSVATIAVYLLAPLCIVWMGWKSLFYLCAGIALCFAILWIKGFSRVENALAGEAWKGKTWKGGTDREPGTGGKLFHGKVCVILGCIMLAIVMQGMLRDGITTWMPSYISETFQLGSAVSILSGVLLPVFSILCLELVSVLNRRLIRNELLCAGTVFLTGFAGTLLLAFLPSLHAGLSVFLSALVTGCMYGVNLILVSMVPPYFKGSGRVGTVSGVLNSCTYVGSAISSYAFAWVAGQWGWMMVIWLWTAASAVGTLFCLGSARRWRQMKNEF